MENYKGYTYQLVRYIHDQGTSEYVNVGVIIYHSETNFLKSCFLKKFDRVLNFFNCEPNVEYLKNVLDQFEEGINKIDCNNFFSSFVLNDIDHITSSILPKDDSALQCSEVFGGIDIDLDSALTMLFNSLVNKYSY